MQTSQARSVGRVGLVVTRVELYAVVINCLQILHCTLRQGKLLLLIYSLLSYLSVLCTVL